jgi:catechol 2,3-dioxygenase-like lactoylglutathione lyase family enzyme
VLCADVELTIRFYQDVLEFPLTDIFENRDYKGSNHFFFDIGNGNLLAFFDFPGLDLGPYAEVLGGLHHMAISVEPDTWEGLKGNLDQAGVAYLLESGTSIYFRDPDGTRVELIADPPGRCTAPKCCETSPPRQTSAGLSRLWYDRVGSLPPMATRTRSGSPVPELTTDEKGPRGYGSDSSSSRRRIRQCSELRPAPDSVPPLAHGGARWHPLRCTKSGGSQQPLTLASIARHRCEPGVMVQDRGGLCDLHEQYPGCPRLRSLLRSAVHPPAADIRTDGSALRRVRARPLSAGQSRPDPEDGPSRH